MAYIIRINVKDNHKICNKAASDESYYNDKCKIYGCLNLFIFSQRIRHPQIQIKKSINRPDKLCLIRPPLWEQIVNGSKKESGNSAEKQIDLSLKN